MTSLADIAEPFIIKVGANDGQKGDPIWKLIQTGTGWRGIFVEPVPCVFDRLVSNLGNDNRFVLANLAIAESDGTRELFYVADDAANAFEAPLPPWYDEVASFSRSHVRSHFGNGIERYIRSVSVRCCTLASLCAAHDVHAVDLLHIDAEGYDYQVLVSLDFEKWRPRVVVFEHRHLDSAERILAVRFLEARNYRVRTLGPDMVGVAD